MAAPALGIPIVVLNETLGAMLIGLILGSMLQGINNGQTIYYFRHSQSDPYVIKCLICSLLLVNALQVFFIGAAVFIRTVDQHGDPDGFGKLNWGDMAVVIVSALSDFGVKGIFSYRVWRLSQQWTLSVAIMSGAFVTFGFSLFLAISMAMAPNSLPNRVGTLGSLTTLAISDVIMSIVLAMVFWRRRSVFSSVNRILRVAILYTMETSLVTAVGSTAGVIMYVTLPNTAVFEAVLWILPHLILGSLLVALNAREGLRKRSAVILSPIVRSDHHRSFDARRTWQSGI